MIPGNESPRWRHGAAKPPRAEIRPALVGSVVVTCCYGYMFPTEKETALAETLRVLKPGGTLVATTWDILRDAA